MAVDGRGITSRYDVSESDTDSLHSGQDQIARTVSLARRYVSTVSLFALRNRDSNLAARGKGVRSTASESLLRGRSCDQVAGHQRPTTSYIFYLGKEQDGLVEIIPETLVYDDEVKHDILTKVVPATPNNQDDDESINAEENASYQQWRHSALLPLPDDHPAARPGTRESSVSSQDDLRSKVFDITPRVLNKEETTRTQASIPGQLHLRTRSLLSLARRYTSDDSTSIFRHYDGEVSPMTSVAGDATLQDDDCSVYSQDEMAVPAHRRRSISAETMISATSLPTPARNSWDTKPLPPLPIEHDQQTWLFLPPRDEPLNKAASKTRSRADSSTLPGIPDLVQGQTTRHSERRVGASSETPPLRHRPSSWSWLSFSTALSDEASSSADRKRPESSIFHGQRYLRVSISRASARNVLSPEAEAASFPASPPPRYSRIYRGEAARSDHEETPSSVPQLRSNSGRRAARQDPLQLPPLQLPELSDERRISFYIKCGHLETNPQLIVKGPQLPGWCPRCSKGRLRKRRVVKKELKLMLRSIAE